MATDTASRCVRREVGALRKMVEQRADGIEALTFYSEHFHFVCRAFHLKPLQATREKRNCDEKSGRVKLFLDLENYSEALAWIDALAVSEPLKLAALAVEGVL